MLSEYYRMILTQPLFKSEVINLTCHGCITFNSLKASAHITSFVMPLAPRSFEMNISTLLQSYIIIFGGILIGL